ncbi:MAG: uroporphyrinogen-III C-methyltransferase [Pseudomonadota bacterium]
MSSEPDPKSIAEPAAAVPVAVLDAPAASAGQGTAALVSLPRGVLLVLIALVIASLVASGLLWQKLSSIQRQLARQSADAGTVAIEARALAKQAQERALETAARQAVTDSRLSEVALQRSQLEELMQSLSRSRDENLVVDIESAIRLAQQQAQLTGSVEPLLAALKSADQRVSRAAQPRLASVQRAMARDIERIKAASVTDTPGLLIKLDDLMRQVDDLPVANAVIPVSVIAASKPAPSGTPSALWDRALQVVLAEVRGLVRVSRIEQPEAVLLTPEQTFFLRENLKLKLLNARLGLLARQVEGARADVASASLALGKYFDPASRKTQAAAGLLQQVQSQMKTVELPRVDETLAALATAAAGR